MGVAGHLKAVSERFKRYLGAAEIGRSEDVLLAPVLLDV
jgi:hypothetical protein